MLRGHLKQSMLVQDFEEQGSIYGLEKLWAFFKYSKVDLKESGVERDVKVSQTALCFWLAE